MQRAICCRIFSPATLSECPTASLRDYCAGVLIDRRKADMVLTEPLSGFAARRYRRPDFGSGKQEKPEGEFGELLAAFLRLAEQASSLGGSVSVVLDLQQNEQCHETEIKDRKA
jgi:hypothetical protein